MNIILWIVLGALAGWIASLVMRTDEEQGALMNIILGIVGAFVGGLVLNMFGASGVSGFNIYSVIVATLGAVAVIWLGKLIYR